MDKKQYRITVLCFTLSFKLHLIFFRIIIIVKEDKYTL